MITIYYQIKHKLYMINIILCTLTSKVQPPKNRMIEKNQLSKFDF